MKTHPPLPGLRSSLDPGVPGTHPGSVIARGVLRPASLAALLFAAAVRADEPKNPNRAGSHSVEMFDWLRFLEFAGRHLDPAR